MITGHETEPTISTHFAPTAAGDATSVVARVTETVTAEAAASSPPPPLPLAAPPEAAAEGQALTGPPPPSTSLLSLLSPVAEKTELPETADGGAAAAAAAQQQPLSSVATRTEPAFDVQMRTHQRQKIKSYHDAKQTAVWRTDSLVSNPSSTMCPQDSLTPAAAGVVVGLPMRGVVLSTAPSILQRKSSDSSLAAAIPRRVSFPDNALVTGYLEPANPWKQACLVRSIAEIVDEYKQSCLKHLTEPLTSIVDHLNGLDLTLQARQPLLSLKGSQLKPNDCEALEEIFKRIQYKTIDLSECKLDESCLSPLFQMIEYYEAALELDISYNKETMTKRCWELCACMVDRSRELRLLNAESNQITRLGAESLGHALESSNLHTLKLEHCGLRGPPLTELCRGLHKNKMLKELWMGYNDLNCTDAKHIADMLRFNHSLELIDISNNNIRDEGCKYLVQDLILQSTELERRLGALKRARAIEVDESLEATDYSPSSVSQTETNFAFGEPAGESSAASEPSSGAVEQPSAAASNSEPAVGILVDVENDNEDDNTEDDTVRTVKNCSSSSGGGQSMLDKLLSMNSDSSSSMEEAPSTDTLAACCSEDISEISNEIFEASSGKQQQQLQQQQQQQSAEAKEINEGAVEVSSTVVDAKTKASAAGESTAEEMQQQQQQQQQSSQNERNLCDITPSTEAKTVEPKPNESCVQNNNINNNNNNNNNTTQAAAAAAAGAAPQNAENTGVSPSPSGSSTPPAVIFEVTAEESDCCINGGGNGVALSGSRPLDVNKNAKSAGDDFEDTHSMDSAFESASEGDISRHLPEEFSRLSVSLESTRLDDMAKEMGGIETATIATESTECLLVAEEAATATTAAAPPTPVVINDSFQQPKVTIAEECRPSTYSYTGPSPTPTPPPPSTSPGGASIGMRRTESSCAYLNQSTRNWSHSAESLCSDTSLEGNNSNNSAANDPDFAEKLTKNDTLSRRQLAEAANLEAANRAPSGLKALTMWNNNLTKDCAGSVAELLEKTISLELLNIGKNCLSNDFVSTIKESLTKNTTLTTLGLQSAHLSAKGIETLASILSFGGNSKLQRIDIRDNKLEVESLNIIAEVLKSNKTLTQIDINDEPKRLTIGSDAHLDYTRVLGTVRSMCSRNEKMQAQELAERAAIVGGAGINSTGNSNSSGSFSSSGYRCRGGYYLGSRKISLTCQSRPFVDATTGTVTSVAATVAMPTSAAALLEVKRKTGTRLRSPGPSPPTISPSSSPNRSRFHVSRVTEVSSISSSLISPLAQMPPQHPPTPRSASSCMSIPTIGGCSPSGSQSSLNAVGVGTLPTSSSLPAMASVTSSTQTVKRLSVSPRSRFHVSRIYEDPQVPMANRQLPPISPHTPPIDLPPTPMLKSSRKAVQLSEAVEAAAAAAATATSSAVVTISSVVIVEPAVDEPEESEAHRNNSTNADEAAGQKLSPHFTPNSPILSNSCSTSPGSSISSGSSSTSSSSCTNACAGSSSSSSSTSNDITDSISSGPLSGCLEEVPRTCPLAVFGDNDITLTKESAAVVALSAAVPVVSVPVPEADPETAPEPEPAPVSNPQPAARSRKTSWIANPSAVDKLLTLFNPGAIFQRSSSPEPKASSQQQQVSVPNTAPNNAQTDDGGNATTQTTTILSVTQKNSPSSWTTLTGGSHCSISNSNSNSTSNSNSNLDSVAGTGGSSSFLDTASRQLRDFSKQVFRQNISFNNSGDGAASSGPAAVQLDGNGATCTTTTTTTSSSSSTESASPPECNAAYMPPSLKRQLKENISPEHTINEETLHTLQKLSPVEDVPADLGDIEIVMYSEVTTHHCLPEEQKQKEETHSTE